MRTAALAEVMVTVLEPLVEITVSTSLDEMVDLALELEAATVVEVWAVLELLVLEEVLELETSLEELSVELSVELLVELLVVDTTAVELLVVALSLLVALVPASNEPKETTEAVDAGTV